MQRDNWSAHEAHMRERKAILEAVVAIVVLLVLCCLLVVWSARGDDTPPVKTLVESPKPKIEGSIYKPPVYDWKPRYYDKRGKLELGIVVE